MMTPLELDEAQTSLLEELASAYDARFCTDYSGRGMYGNQCIGITVENTSVLLHIIVALAADEPDLAEELCDGICSDNMGRDMIFYWPGITAEHPTELDADPGRNDGWET